MEGGYIYWTDIHYNTVNRALKSSGNEQIRLAEGVEPVSSVIVVKKSQLRRRGDLFVIVIDQFPRFLYCIQSKGLVNNYFQEYIRESVQHTL